MEVKRNKKPIDEDKEEYLLFDDFTVWDLPYKETEKMIDNGLIIIYASLCTIILVIFQMG